MIANNSFLTQSSKSHEITQFYYSPEVILPPDNRNLQSLYGFVSYHEPWDEVVLTSTIDPTVVIYDSAILSGTKILNLVNAVTLNDFFVGQTVTNPALPGNTKIVLIDEDNFSVTLNNNAVDHYIGPSTFVGFIPFDNKVTIHNTNLASDIDGYYNKCAAKIDVVNIPGELTYYRGITNYDAETKTLTVDNIFNDAPFISSSSTLQIVYDNTHPPPPKDTVKYKKEIFKNMFYLKKITSNNISPVVKRIDWVSDSVYDYYRDDINLSEKYPDGTPVYKFYVMNQFYQIFICLWNNNGGKSIVEPYFVAGNFDDITNIFYDPDDGYKWKYLYTISYSKLQQFMNEDWIPIAVTEPPDPKGSSEKGGGIEVINVTNKGTNYDLSNTIVDVVITGDGSGATAYAEVDSSTKTIQNVVVKTAGYDYTTASVEIISTQGSDAAAIPIISPPGGIGSDVMTELGCDRIMVSFLLQGSEENKLPIDMQIRQIGLIGSPLAESTYPFVANAESYSTSTDVVVSNGFGGYQDSEIIYQTTNNANFANATFTATCVNFESAPNRIRLVNTQGTPTLGSSVYGLNSGTVRTLLQVITPDLIKFSGNIIHIENREEIQRSADGIELFRLVLKF